MQDNLIAIADSLGWALVHSIWQVTAIAILAFIVLRLIPRNNPQLRFTVAYLGMIGSALAFAVTFFVYFGATAASGAAAAPVGWAAYLDMLGKMTWLISLCWALGFIALGTRYVQSLRQTQRLRRDGTSAVPEKWEARFRLWLERLGGDPQASILYSDRVRTPVTIGAFKPVILVPAGFFMRLPADQAEAVLVHEIAHVCRQDYLLGLVQAMIANIFFFHPGIYYLSRQIDIEREYACDDRAASETGNAGPLAEALSRIAMERETAHLGFAMAADGPHTPIMDRINRLGRRPVADRSSGLPLAALSMAFAASLIVAIGADASVGASKASETEGDILEGIETQLLAAASDENAGDLERGRQTFSKAARLAVPSAPSRPASPQAPTAPDAPECCEEEAEAAETPTVAGPAEPARRSRSAPYRMPSAEKHRAMVRPATFMEISAPVQATAVRRNIEIEHESEEQCEETERRAERARERAEHRAERARARAERQAARIALQQERLTERIEREMERRAEHLERLAEQRAERHSRRMEGLSDKVGREVGDENEREIDRYINGRLTITARPRAPQAPDSPAVHSMSLSVGTALIF